MPRKYLQDITTKQYVYKQEHDGPDQEIVADCSEGINPFGAPPGILDVLTFISESDLHLYPDLLAGHLRDAICTYWNDTIQLEKDEIFFAPGSLGVLERINKFMFEVGDRVLGYSPQYPMYVNELKIAGLDYLTVELPKNKGLTFDYAVAEQMIKKINNDIHAVYLDSPNNPTGQYISFQLLEQIVEAAYRKAIPVIVDEAYGDFLPKDHSAVVFLKKYDNVIVVRSFSKGFGLAGIRVGYGISRGHLKTNWQKVDIPATLSTVTTKLAAFALKKIDYLEDCRLRTRQLKEQIFLACQGFIICASHPDVPLFTLGWEDPQIDLHRCFREAGILTSAGNHFQGLGDNFVRIRIPKEKEVFIETLFKVKELASGNKH